MNFVIIGGDAAGMSAASRAKRNQPDLNVTVLEKTLDVSYSACGMPYNIADPERRIEDLVVRRAEVFREKQGIDLLTGHCVEKLDVKNRVVSGTTQAGDRFQYAYDRLLIATGASAIVPDLPGFDLPGVLALKSLEQGRAIKQYIRENAVKRVVIIGMGYIALEMCEALRSLDLEVDLVKPRPTLLPWMDETLAQVVKAEVESHGAGLFPGHPIKGIDASAGGLRVVCEDMALTGDMVLVAVGVAPNSGFAAQAGIQTGVKGAIAVDRTLKTSAEHIYAAGD